MSPPSTIVSTINHRHHHQPLSPPSTIVSTINHCLHHQPSSSPSTFVTTINHCLHHQPLSPPSTIVFTINHCHHHQPLSPQSRVCLQAHNLALRGQAVSAIQRLQIPGEHVLVSLSIRTLPFVLVAQGWRSWVRCRCVDGPSWHAWPPIHYRLRAGHIAVRAHRHAGPSSQLLRARRRSGRFGQPVTIVPHPSLSSLTRHYCPSPITIVPHPSLLSLTRHYCPSPVTIVPHPSLSSLTHHYCPSPVTIVPHPSLLSVTIVPHPWLPAGDVRLGLRRQAGTLRSRTTIAVCVCKPTPVWRRPLTFRRRIRTRRVSVGVASPKPRNHSLPTCAGEDRIPFVQLPVGGAGPGLHPGEPRSCLTRLHHAETCLCETQLGARGTDVRGPLGHSGIVQAIDSDFWIIFLPLNVFMILTFQWNPVSDCWNWIKLSRCDVLVSKASGPYTRVLSSYSSYVRFQLITQNY